MGKRSLADFQWRGVLDLFVEVASDEALEAHLKSAQTESTARPTFEIVDRAWALFFITLANAYHVHYERRPDLVILPLGLRLRPRLAVSFKQTVYKLRQNYANSRTTISWAAIRAASHYIYAFGSEENPEALADYFANGVVTYKGLKAWLPGKRDLLKILTAAVGSPEWVGRKVFIAGSDCEGDSDGYYFTTPDRCLLMDG